MQQSQFSHVVGHLDQLASKLLKELTKLDKQFFFNSAYYQSDSKKMEIFTRNGENWKFLFSAGIGLR